MTVSIKIHDLQQVFLPLFVSSAYLTIRRSMTDGWRRIRGFHVENAPRSNHLMIWHSNQNYSSPMASASGSHSGFFWKAAFVPVFVVSVGVCFSSWRLSREEEIWGMRAGLKVMNLLVPIETSIVDASWFEELFVGLFQSEWCWNSIRKMLYISLVCLFVCLFVYFSCLFVCLFVCLFFHENSYNKCLHVINNNNFSSNK